MKKKHVFFLFASIAFVFITQNVFAEILPGLDCVGDCPRPAGVVDPIEIIQTFIKGILTVLAGLFAIPGVIGLYLCPCLGIYLLSKKYYPSISPVFSWVPFVNLYPLTKSAGISGWWSLSFLVPILPIYVFMKLAQRLKRGAGTTIGLFFLPQFMIAYLGLKEAGKSTWPAWVFGLSGIALIVIFFAWKISYLVFTILSGSTVTA